MAKPKKPRTRRRRPRKVSEAQELLASLGLPPAQQNERSALTLLALARLAPEDSWASAEPVLLRTVDIMDFIRRTYRRKYAPNTRETIRRQSLHQLLEAGIVDLNPDAPNRPTNSGLNRYALSAEALEVLRAFGSPSYEPLLARFLASHEPLKERARQRRALTQIPVTLPDGAEVLLSPGRHNLLHKAIVEEFAPRFAQGSSLVYLGDTARKQVVLDNALAERLGLQVDEHDKLPDIVLYQHQRDWLFLIEAVTSHGPLNHLRVQQLRRFASGTSAGLVLVTAFPSRADFRRHAAGIAWETEVWIADEPDHLIHFDGQRFLGPYPLPNE